MSSPNHPNDEPIEPILPEAADPPVKPLKIEDWLSVLILAALAIITFANVVIRYLTDSSFAWTEEISVFLLIVLTMTAGATAFVRNQHIRIELFADGGTPARRPRLPIISHSLVVDFFLLLTLLSARMAIHERSEESRGGTAGVSTCRYRGAP